MSRKSTFNASETNKLFEICEKFKNVIECRKTDCVSAKDKDAAWEKIAQEFNSRNEIFRETKDIRKKYKNMKYATKTKAAEERRSIYGTGGGPATASIPLSGVEERMLSMLNNKEMEGIPNTAVSDTVRDVHPIDITPEVIFETPPLGPAILREKASAPLWTPRKQCNRSAKNSSWDYLASIKSEWVEAKLEAEVSLAKKEEERVALQMKLMLEKHELDVLQQKERQVIEMEVLSVKLQKAQLELKKLYD